MIVFVIAAIVGLVKKQQRNYWLAVAAGIGIHLLANLLFAGGGTIADPRGDGFITAAVRKATSEGPWLLLIALFAMVAGWVVPLALRGEVPRGITLNP